MAGLRDQIALFKDVPVWIFVVVFLALMALFTVMYLMMKKKGLGSKTPLAKEQAKKK